MVARAEIDTKAETTTPSPRPRFDRHVALAPDDVLERVREALRGDESVRGVVLPTGRIELTVADRDRHLWSPQLTIDIEDDANESSSLRARFGPHPHVWTLYVALYALSVIFAIGCAVVGVSQMVLERDPWALWLTPIAVVFAGLVYGASYVGQGLGSEQMYRVRSFLEDALSSETAVAKAPQDS